ncbi:response regulator transcription factor [Alicyclobacillus vulcanalis]|uniref:Heme response regulator HssR n=1 Tax=Alicyclobacillus vulcanalis TaxID=252246 RepID=A0A1N7MBX6_9BACL|nr:response regulator transcription factor [Alicyclobacillus vulcanalis]SIS83558.1 DNA-binding response regulator, OmpR family, contains REC and winged-helix (wHTH) domain [Alicyclobacillus vulcanalis]
MATLLVADDEPHIRELVRNTLEREGHRVLEAADGRQAADVIEREPVQLAVIDVLMPEVDGWELCAYVREVRDIPILMLTALGETGHKVRGLRLGADDYLVKPFAPEELVARIEALLRRYRIRQDGVLDLAGLRLFPDTYEVEAHGERTALPPKEFQLLFTLASSAGRTLSRDKLIEDVWGYDYAGDERTVDVHIKRLRDKFPEDVYPFRIRTVRGLGYRLEVSP